jgi:hypothetical protein
MLSDREQEIEELNFVLNDPGSHFLLVSGPPGATFRSYFRTVAVKLVTLFCNPPFPNVLNHWN